MTVLDLVAKLSVNDQEYIDGLGKAEEKAKSGLGSALKTAGKVGAAALSAATTAVVAFGKKAVETGMDFDKSMSQVAATMGLTVDQIGDLREFAMDMGASTSFSAIQAADALNYMALAGYDAETSMKMLPTVLDLAAAGGMDLAAASDMVTDSQSALGLSLEETEAMVDMMAKTSSKSNTSVAQLGEAFLTIGATARNVSGGVEELSTLLGVLADNGIKGAEGGTHMRNVLLSLQEKAEDGALAIGDMSVAVYDADGNMRSVVDIIEDMQVALGDMDQASRDAIIGGIFNKPDLAAVNALIGTSADRFSELTAEIGNATGAAEAMANTQLDNLAGDVTLFKSALEGAMIVLSDQLTPTMRKFVSFGTDAVSKLSAAFQEGGLTGAMDALGTILSDGLNMVIETLPSLVEAGSALLSALIEGIFQNLPTILEAGVAIIQQVATSIIEALPEFGPTVIQMMASLYNMILENLPTILELGLQFVQALCEGILNSLSTLAETSTSLIDNIVSFFTENLPTFVQTGMTIIIAFIKGLIDSIPQLVQAVADIVKAIVEFFLNDGTEGMLQDGIEMIMSLIEGLMQQLPDIIQAIFDILTSMIQYIVSHLPEFVQMGVELIVSLITGLMDALPDIIQAIIDVLTTLVEYIIDNLPMFLEAGLQIIVSLAQALIDNAPEVLDAMLTLVESLITLIIDNLGEFVAQGLEILISIGKGIAEAVPELLAKVGEVIKGLWDAFVNTDWGEVGGNIIDGIKDGIGGAVGRLWNAAVNAAKTALAKIKSVLGIASPSKVFRDQVGKMIPEGMAIGIEANTDSVEDAMADIADLTTDPFAGMSNIVKFPEQGKGGQTYGGIVLNVYASEGMDVEEFADYTIDKLNQELEREGRALA